MIIGTLPVVIAIAPKLRRAPPGARVEAPLAWGRLAPSLVLIGAGIALVNHVELDRLRSDPNTDLARYALGALLAVGAVACWTWYPIRNAEWLDFVALMFAIGLFASWIGTLCWNEASQRLPPTLSGQLIVFEALAALSYAFLLRGEGPRLETLVGIALLVAGVVWAVRGQPATAAPSAHG